MVNQQLVDSHRRSQKQYPQARYFTPGRTTTDYSITHEGRPRQMDLLVVLHHDVPPTAIGQQRVDLIVNSGSPTVRAVHGNGHLVNVYDQHDAVTDHTELYTDAQLEAVRSAVGSPVEIPDRDGYGPPGAEVYSVRGLVRIGERGQPMLDTDAQMVRGSGASPQSLHNVQQGMNLRQRADGTAPVRETLDQRYQRAQDERVVTGVPRFADRAAYGTGPGAATRFEEQQDREAAREAMRPSVPAASLTPPMSSQAGLSAMQGPRHSVPSSPAPGQPGSRFNPTVRERAPRRMDGQAVERALQDPHLITEVPTSFERVERDRSPQVRESGPTYSPSSQAGLAARQGPRHSVPSSPPPGDPGSRFNPRVRERTPGRIDDGPVPDGAAPEQPKRRMRMPTAEEISAGGRIARQGAAGAAVGAKLSAAIPHPAGKVIGVVGGAVVGGAKGLVGEADQRVEAKKQAQAQETERGKADKGEDVKSWLPDGLKKNEGPSTQSEPPVSDTYGYQFEQGPQGPQGQSDPEMGR